MIKGPRSQTNNELNHDDSLDELNVSPIDLDPSGTRAKRGHQMHVQNSGDPDRYGNLKLGPDDCDTTQCRHPCSVAYSYLASVSIAMVQTEVKASSTTCRRACMHGYKHVHAWRGGRPCMHAREGRLGHQ
jgi:hypothetical protein